MSQSAAVPITKQKSQLSSCTCQLSGDSQVLHQRPDHHVTWKSRSSHSASCSMKPGRFGGQKLQQYLRRRRKASTRWMSDALTNTRGRPRHAVGDCPDSPTSDSAWCRSTRRAYSVCTVSLRTRRTLSEIEADKMLLNLTPIRILTERSQVMYGSSSGRVFKFPHLLSRKRTSLDSDLCSLKLFFAAHAAMSLISAALVLIGLLAAWMTR